MCPLNCILWVSSLTLSISANDILKYVFFIFFFQRIRFDISRKLGDNLREMSNPIFWEKKKKKVRNLSSAELAQGVVKAKGTSGRFSAFFTRETTFVTCFAFLHSKSPLRRSLLYKERVCSLWTKFFAFRVNPFSE